MTEVHYAGATIRLYQGESVLDGLLRTGHAIANGCRSGVCQSCVMVSASDEVPATARRGLSDAQLALDHFLACQCVPQSAISVMPASHTELRTRASVVGKQLLAVDIVRLRLQADISYRAGQYLTLWKDGQVARSYSLASHPLTDEHLEFHIRLLEQGRFSQWVWQSLQVGDSVDIQGPMGKCFYTGRPDQPMLLAATGTGLAPLYGVLKDALLQRHRARIDLVLAARRADQFYLLKELRALAARHEQLKLHLLVLEGSGPDLMEADVYSYCQQHFTELRDTKIYLCGADSFVKKLRRQLFLAGAGMSNIAADAFLPCG